MKKIILASAALLCSIASGAQEPGPVGVVVSIDINRTATLPGVYAGCAEELLGLDVPQTVETSVCFSKVKMGVESKPYGVQTYISSYNAGRKIQKAAVKPALADASDLFEKAGAVAAEIAQIREERHNIVIGNTDANYTGEALGDAVKYLSSREELLMSLFTPTMETMTDNAQFVVIPEKDCPQQKYVVCRIDKARGIVDSFDADGEAVTLEFDILNAPEEVESPAADSVEVTPVAQQTRKGRNEPQPVVRKVSKFIPAVCCVSLKYGRKVLLHSEMIIPQLGYNEEYTVFE